MKKLIFLLLILSVKLSAQTPFNLRAPLQQVYKTGSVNDTTIQKFSADSALWQTSKSRFKFNKQIHAPLILMGFDTASTKAYVRSLIGVESDPVWTLAQPYYVTRVELGDTAESIRASIGSSSSADSLKFLTTYSAAQTYLKIVDTTKLHNQITAKQPQLSGTGFVKASGTTITYDNSTYQPAGSYVLSSDTANYISKSQARKDINDSITPLREDIRTLQAENFLGYYPIPPNDTLKIPVGNIFTDDGIFISRFVLKDSLGNKHLGENLNILSDINAIYIDYGKNITNASINFSQSFQIAIDLESIYWVIINRNSYRLFLKYFKNTITNQL